MLIVGCGYLGTRLARDYLSRGERVSALVRSEGSAERLRALGITAYASDLDQRVPLPLDTEGEKIFYFAPPPDAGVADPRIRGFLASCETGGAPRRLVYASTTGVYGDRGGEWIDETAPLRPQADRARRRLDAENALRVWSARTFADILVLRVAGIYGPGRLPLERLRQGMVLVREDEAPFSNRIHIDDLVQVCAAAMERGRAGEIYHACDGNPSSMTDYFLRLAALTGAPRPQTVSLDEAAGRLSPAMMSYLRESRRLSNRKIREELGVWLRYPSLASGLPACMPDA